MGIKRSIFLCWLISSLPALASFSVNNSFSSSISCFQKNGEVLLQPYSPTKFDLEKGEISSGYVCQSTVNKKLPVAFLRKLNAITYAGNTWKIIFVKISQLTGSDYLFHIYPSHNFW